MWPLPTDWELRHSIEELANVDPADWCSGLAIFKLMQHPKRRPNPTHPYWNYEKVGWYNTQKEAQTQRCTDTWYFLFYFEFVFRRNQGTLALLHLFSLHHEKCWFAAVSAACKEDAVCRFGIPRTARYIYSQESMTWWMTACSIWTEDICLIIQKAKHI